MQLNKPTDGPNGYIVFSHHGQRAEGYAETPSQASDIGRAHWKTPKSKRHLVHSMLAEKNGEPVIHSTTEL